MTDIDEMIEAFRRGTFDLDCTMMDLRQRKEGGHRFKGRGYIRQIEGGALVFKLYVDEKENAGPPAIFDMLTGGASGALLGDDELYDLTVTSVDGTSWKAVRITGPRPNWDMQDDTGVLSGSLHSIVAGTMLPPPKPHLLRLHFFEEYALSLHSWSPDADRPLQGMVRDRSEFEACGAKFNVRSRLGSGDTIVQVTADTAFPPAFDLRIQEALQYITGKSAIWRARLETCQGMFALELASPRPKAVRTQFNPPISPASAEFHHQVWPLFERFLTYVIENTAASGDSRHWNSVAYHLYIARESTSASIDAWAVGVSVAVEALASLAEVCANRKTDGGWANFRTRALEWLEEQPDFPENVKNRARGLIRSSADKGVKQTLRELAEIGRADKKYVDAWGKLRHRHVHPNLADLRLPGAADYRELLRRLWQVGMLLHQLTFHLIGYEGPFTEYSRVGLGSRQYPLSESEEVGADEGSRISP
jgi:hypothetical protein